MTGVTSSNSHTSSIADSIDLEYLEPEDVKIKYIKTDSGYQPRIVFDRDESMLSDLGEWRLRTDQNSIDGNDLPVPEQTIILGGMGGAPRQNEEQTVFSALSKLSHTLVSLHDARKESYHESKIKKSNLERTSRSKITPKIQARIEAVNEAMIRAIQDSYNLGSVIESLNDHIKDVSSHYHKKLVEMTETLPSVKNAAAGGRKAGIMRDAIWHGIKERDSNIKIWRYMLQQSIDNCEQMVDTDSEVSGADVGGEEAQGREGSVSGESEETEGDAEEDKDVELLDALMDWHETRKAKEWCEGVLRSSKNDGSVRGSIQRLRILIAIAEKDVKLDDPMSSATCREDTVDLSFADVASRSRAGKRKQLPGTLEARLTLKSDGKMVGFPGIKHLQNKGDSSSSVSGFQGCEPVLNPDLRHDTTKRYIDTIQQLVQAQVSEMDNLYDRLTSSAKDLNSWEAKDQNEMYIICDESANLDTLTEGLVKDITEIWKIYSRGYAGTLKKLVQDSNKEFPPAPGDDERAAKSKAAGRSWVELAESAARTRHEADHALILRCIADLTLCDDGDDCTDGHERENENESDEDVIGVLAETGQDVLSTPSCTKTLAELEYVSSHDEAKRLQSRLTAQRHATNGLFKALNIKPLPKTADELMSTLQHFNKVQNSDTELQISETPDNPAWMDDDAVAISLQDLSERSQGFRERTRKFYDPEMEANRVLTEQELEDLEAATRYNDTDCDSELEDEIATLRQRQDAKARMKRQIRNEAKKARLRKERENRG